MVSKFLLVLVFSVLFLNESAFAQARFPFVGEVTVDHARVRAGQNNNFEAVATLDKGAKVVVLEKSYSWYKIRLPENAKAFIKSSYINFLGPDMGEVTGDRVNVRAAMDTNATILGQVVKGQKVLFYQREGEWVWIKPVDGLNAWIHASLIVASKQSVASLSSESPEAIAAKKEAQEAKKFALVKKLDKNKFECSGTLLKTEGAAFPYRIDREGTTACFIEGPTGTLDPFVNDAINVQGPLKDPTLPTDKPVIAISKIKRAF